VLDTIEQNGIRHIDDVPYKGNFTISFYNKNDLVMLQEFFSVRSNKFDMKLLDKRPELLARLKRTNENIDN